MSEKISKWWFERCKCNSKHGMIR